MPYVCRMCGKLWQGASRKPCVCWWGIRIWIEENEEYVCANCGLAWPIGQKSCKCWPNAIRVRKSEAKDQGYPLPGL